MGFLREKMREMKTKELKSFLERGGKDALDAMEEILERKTKGEEIEKDILISGLRAKIPNSEREKSKQLKEGFASILAEKYFDEKTIAIILDCEQVSKKLKEMVAKKYLDFGGENKDLLIEIVKTVKATNVKNSAVQKLLKMHLTLDELEKLYSETEGEAKREAFERILKAEINEGNIKDFIDFIMWFENSDAEKIFNKLKKEGKIQELIRDKENLEENLRTLRLSDNEKISQWATKKLIKRLAEKEKELREKIKENQARIKIATEKNDWALAKNLEYESERIWWEIDDIQKEIKKLKKELKKEKPPSSKIETLALASGFFYFYNGVIHGIKIFSFTLPLRIFSFGWLAKS